MSITVLVIDDAAHIRRLVTRMLSQAGFEVLEAANGMTGLEILKEKQPHVVTCDLYMPIMDGHEFLSLVRADSKIKDTPVIMITAIGQEDVGNTVTQLGANAYITKPFSSSKLIETIKQLHQNPQHKQPR